MKHIGTAEPHEKSVGARIHATLPFQCCDHVSDCSMIMQPGLEIAIYIFTDQSYTYEDSQNVAHTLHLASYS